MRAAVQTITLNAPWVRSLKEKRSLVKSLVAKLKNRFNISAAEVGAQDAHKTIVLGIAIIALDKAQAEHTLDIILNFIEANTDAQLQAFEREFF
ncbi:MAG TPA: DUF503 domain-containing protein [Clostridia bacterium]|nr:DUF503 domain-containing protein [Clostridia bacterium]